MLEGYSGQLALVDVAGQHRKVNVGMLPEETFTPGDWIIINMGFAVEKTDKAGADKAMAGLELMGRGIDAGQATQFASGDMRSAP
jgi:hydrogenase expression/formation protein HypC